MWLVFDRKPSSYLTIPPVGGGLVISMSWIAGVVGNAVEVWLGELNRGEIHMKWVEPVQI